MPVPQISDAICKAFTVALLLSGHVEIAEDVVHEAIGSLDTEDLSSDALLICVITLSLPQSGDKSAQAVVPDELRNVLKLPRMPRQCFVLRMLLGLPLHECASLLHTEPSQISDALSAAYQLLTCGQYEYELIAGSGGSARFGRVDGERSHYA